LQKFANHDSGGEEAVITSPSDSLKKTLSKLATEGLFGGLVQQLPRNVPQNGIVALKFYSNKALVLPELAFKRTCTTARNGKRRMIQQGHIPLGRL
jgi:hypothetical protein